MSFFERKSEPKWEVKVVEGGVELPFEGWFVKTTEFNDHADLFIEIGPRRKDFRLSLCEFEKCFKESIEQVSVSPRSNFELVLKLLGLEISNCFIAVDGRFELSMCNGDVVLRCYPDKEFDNAWELWAIEGEKFLAQCGYAGEGFAYSKEGSG